MSKYIPEICREFINTCSTQTVNYGYFILGIVLAVLLAIIIAWVYFRYVSFGYKRTKKTPKW